MQDEVWPQARGVTEWQTLKEQECEACQSERLRRCRVLLSIPAGEGPHTSPKFAAAPYVHPFNLPKYQAQISHAVLFAKASARKVFWIVAQDELRDTSVFRNSAEVHSRQREWLRKHDKQTAGILGLLPLVKGMPVRLTETCNREVGAFKHATGTLVGWCLPTPELFRITSLVEPEILLEAFPQYLRIQLSNASSKNDTPHLYDLKPCRRTWRDGNIEVHRTGFQLAPDFAGTAHQFCGSTVSACKGDLLHWSVTPTLDSFLRAYIIRSRVRRADDMLIVQPYSPNLFQQPDLPGPTLLLARQQGETGTNEKTFVEAWRLHAPYCSDIFGLRL